MEAIKLRDVIDNINENGKKYYRFYPLLERHPEHHADFDMKWLRGHSDRESDLEAFQVFLGGAGTESDIHSAISSNFFTQTFGQKEWYIFHPVYAPVADPFPSHNITRSGNGFLGNPFSYFHPDYETYPAYKYVDYYNFVLEPGDVLYNPPYFFHNVKNLTKSIGVGYRWVSYRSAWRADSLFTFLDLTKISPTFWQTVQVMRKDVNKVHMVDFGLEDDYKQQIEQQKNK